MTLKAKNTLKDYGMTLLKAFIAGLFVGIGGWAYLSVDNSYIGAILFSFALIMISLLDLRLLTSRVGYLVDDKKTYGLEVLTILVGNLVGILIVVGTIMLININNPEAAIMVRVASVMDTKMDNPWYASFLLAIFCGILMHFSGWAYKRVQNQFAKILILTLIVMIFILTGMEHSVANALYFFLDGITGATLGRLLIIVLGNAVGSTLIEVLLNIMENKKFLTYKKRIALEQEKAAKEAEENQTNV